MHSSTTTTQPQGGNTATATSDTTDSYQWWDTAKVSPTSTQPNSLRGPMPGGRGASVP